MRKKVIWSAVIAFLMVCIIQSVYNTLQAIKEAKHEA